MTQTAQMSSYPTMPIHKGTISSQVTTESIKTYRIVLANEAGDITFNYSNRTPLTITVQPGWSFTAEDSCVSITSTNIVTMS